MILNPTSVAGSSYSLYKEPEVHAPSATCILQNAFNMNEADAQHFLDLSRIDGQTMQSLFNAVKDLDQVSDLVEVVEQEAVALGSRIGSGYYGIVYAHPENDSHVIKRIKRVGYLPSNSSGLGLGEISSGGSLIEKEKTEANASREQRLSAAIEEARLFCCYYGTGSARVIMTEENVYIEMLRIPGERIGSIGYGQFASDAIERFWDMLYRLDHLGIWHNDISLSNILYDKETNIFYPVDIANMMSSSRGLGISEPATEYITLNTLDDIRQLIEYINNNTI